MKILAVDPGYERLGIAVLEKQDGGKETLLFSECFKTSNKLPHAARLANIGAEIERIITLHAPEALAIETLFFNNNQKTAFLVSEARGVILYEAARKNLSVHEYTPPQIKTAVTGYGRGDKRHVMDMVKKLIVIEKDIKHDDEFDAIATGLTHLAYSRFREI